MHILSETIARIAIYLTKLAESVSEAELNFKLNRAAKFDRLLKDGEKRTAAETLIRFDQDLIKLEGEVERLRGYIKRCDNVITTIQTHISVKKIEATSLG
jgi:phosphotransferase system IIA component